MRLAWCGVVLRCVAWVVLDQRLRAGIRSGSVDEVVQEEKQHTRWRRTNGLSSLAGMSQFTVSGASHRFTVHHRKRWWVNGIASLRSARSPIHHGPRSWQMVGAWVDSE